MAASANRKSVSETSDLDAKTEGETYRPASAETLDAAELERTAHSSPARELQHGLSQWAAGSAAPAIEEGKLPVAQRMIVILSASLALWAAIIAIIGQFVPIW